MEILTVKENGQGGFLVNGTINVPNAGGNRHYRMIQEWEADGGVVEPFETEEERITRENKEKVATLEEAVQAHLDSTAREHGYDNIISACSYAGSTNPFQDEGKAFIIWRSDVWVYCYQVLTDVQNGIREEPTVEKLLEELPTLS